MAVAGSEYLSNRAQLLAAEECFLSKYAAECMANRWSVDNPNVSIRAGMLYLELFSRPSGPFESLQWAWYVSPTLFQGMVNIGTAENYLCEDLLVSKVRTDTD